MQPMGSSEPWPFRRWERGLQDTQVALGCFGACGQEVEISRGEHAPVGHAEDDSSRHHGLNAAPHAHLRLSKELSMAGPDRRLANSWSATRLPQSVACHAAILIASWSSL